MRLMRFLRPTPPPGLGASLCARVCAAASRFFSPVFLLSRTRWDRAHPAPMMLHPLRRKERIDLPQIAAQLKHALGDAPLEVLGERWVFLHLLAHRRARDLQTEDPIPRNDRRTVIVLDQHCHLAD